jgi:hypothetical protein
MSAPLTHRIGPLGRVEGATGELADGGPADIGDRTLIDVCELFWYDGPVIGADNGTDDTAMAEGPGTTVVVLNFRRPLPGGGGHASVSSSPTASRDRLLEY